MKRVEVVDIEEIQELLLSFAEGNYSKRLEVSDNRDERDIIIAGINMLGEELESSTVSKDYFKSIYNAISDAVIVLDSQGVVTSANETFREKFLSHSQSIIGQPISALFSSDNTTKTINRIMSGEVDLGFFETDFTVDGIKRYYSCTITKMQSRFEVHQGYLVIAKDITQEKLLESQVLKAIIDTEEKEKRRLAYDLHDALGQELNGVKMFFDTLIAMEERGGQFDELMETCRSVINDCIGTTRNLSYDLMPKSLEDGALFSAFEELELKNRNFLDVEINVPDEEYDIKTETKINIFRITQEFITNSLKHGKASQVKIETHKDDSGYHFLLSDDGVGFDTNKSAKGRGLNNIASRLKVIGASHNFYSKPNIGTQLKFHFYDY